MKNRNKLYLAFLVIGVSTLTFIFKSPLVKSASSQEDVNETQIKTDFVTKTASCDRINFSGFVEGKNQADITPKVSGRITAVFKKEGDPVKAGEPIFSIDSEEASTGVENSKNMLDSTKDSKNKAGDYYDRLVKEAELARDIAKDNGGDDYDQAKKALSSAKAARDLQLSLLDTQITATQGILNSSTVGLSNYTVTAPYSGDIVRINVKVGDFVSPGKTIFTIADLTHLEIASSLPKKEAENLSVGQTVDINLNEEKGTGKIFALSSAGDIASFKTSVRVLINDNQPFRLGDFVQMNIFSENSSPVLTISKEAINYRYDNAFAFLIDEKNIATEKKIVLGKDCQDRVEILDGLGENDQVAAAGKDKLKNNELVKIYGK